MKKPEVKHRTTAGQGSEIAFACTRWHGIGMAKGGNGAILGGRGGTLGASGQGMSMRAGPLVLVGPIALQIAHGAEQHGQHHQDTDSDGACHAQETGQRIGLRSRRAGNIRRPP